MESIAVRALLAMSKKNNGTEVVVPSSPLDKYQDLILLNLNTLHFLKKSTPPIKKKKFVKKVVKRNKPPVEEATITVAQKIITIYLMCGQSLLRKGVQERRDLIIKSTSCTRKLSSLRRGLMVVLPCIKKKYQRSQVDSE